MNINVLKFFEKETKPDAMNCRFKTNKTLNAVKETKHIVTTAAGRTIHKKEASNVKFRPLKKPEEAIRPKRDATGVANSATTNTAKHTRELWPKAGTKART